MAKEPVIRVDASASAYQVHRYFAHVTNTKYNNHGTIEENSEILWRKEFYQVQWANVRYDLKRIFFNPFLIPRMAYATVLFFMLYLGKIDNILEFVFIGAIAFDAAAQTSHSGEPSTITWSHTIGSGSDRLININVNGLSSLNAPKFDANDTTQIVTVSAGRYNYYLEPEASASNDCTADGGNIKVGGSISFDGVDQTTPIGATMTEGSPGGSPQDIALTTDTNNSFRVDCAEGYTDDGHTPTATLDSGDLRHSDIVPQNQFQVANFGYTNFQATAGADTHEWTYVLDNSPDMAAFEIHEKAGGASTAVKDVIQEGIIPSPR